MIFDGVELDVQQLVERWLRVKTQAGNELVAECPWDIHRSGQAKLYINLESGLWDCKACNDKQGDIVKLVRLMEDLSYDEATEWLVENGSEIDLATFGERISDMFDESNYGALRTRSEKALRGETRELMRECDVGVFDEYWSSRGLTEFIVKRNQLCIRKDPSDGYKYIIPIYWNGKFRYYIKRASGNVRFKYMYQKGIPRREILYGFTSPEPSYEVGVIVEGPLDALCVNTALKYYQLHKTHRAVAIMGSRATPQQVEFMSGAFDDIVLMLDNDEEGKLGTSNLIEQLRKYMTPRVVDYDEATRIRAKDPGDMKKVEIFRAIEHAEIPALMEV